MVPMWMFPVALACGNTFVLKPSERDPSLGFRIAEYGMRWMFRRVPDHPLLAGLEDQHLRDWRGSATTSVPRLTYKLAPQFNYVPTVEWAGTPVTRVWRNGNRGNVASVLIETPAQGDFLPVLDGGKGAPGVGAIAGSTSIGFALPSPGENTNRSGEPNPGSTTCSAALDPFASATSLAQLINRRISVAGGRSERIEIMETSIILCG